MKVMPVTEAKTKLTRILREVEDFEPYYLTKNGRVAGVLVHPDEWESLKETVEILSDKKLMSQIRASRRSRKRYTLREVFDLK